MHTRAYVTEYSDAGLPAIARVGEKNALLAELGAMASSFGLRIPSGFIVTAAAYERYVQAGHLLPLIHHVDNELGARRIDVAEAGRTLRSAFCRAEMPEDLAAALGLAYRRLVEHAGAEVVVRPSPPPVEGAPLQVGQHDAIVNVVGALELIEACRHCYASMFTDRAIRHRHSRGLDAGAMSLPLGVQHLVRADHGGAGLAEWIRGATRSVLVIHAAPGFHGGAVTDHDRYEFDVGPDDEVRLRTASFGAKLGKRVYDCDSGTLRRVETSAEERSLEILTADELQRLARGTLAASRHFGESMQLEWARDGRDGEIFVLQLSRMRTASRARRAPADLSSA